MINIYIYLKQNFTYNKILTYNKKNLPTIYYKNIKYFHNNNDSDDDNNQDEDNDGMAKNC